MCINVCLSEMSLIGFISKYLVSIINYINIWGKVKKTSMVKNGLSNVIMYLTFDLHPLHTGILGNICVI